MQHAEASTLSSDHNLDDALRNSIIEMYEKEVDLCKLPEFLFNIIPRFINHDAMGYTEHHYSSNQFRSRFSVDDKPAYRERAMAAFARHRHSHPFWSADPEFFGERALRDTDIFSEEEYLASPFATEVFLPSNTRHLMLVVMVHNSYSLTLSLHRLLGRPAFSAADRDRFQTFRRHVLRIYRQAQERVIAKLTPVQRLHIVYPDLTSRQIEVADWLIQGKANEDIALILGIGVDAVKAHIKAVFRKVGSDSRLDLTRAAFTAIPFAALPPLWTLDSDVWSG